MFSIILIVLIGLGVALFAQQNTQTVEVAIGNYFFPAIPVYLIVLASMLFGLVIAWVLSLINFFSTALTLRQKDGAIHDAKQQATHLEKEVVQLRQENARLRHDRDTAHGVALHEHPRNDFLERMRERFAVTERKEALT